jgi:S1-C subfamily serine protease
MNKFISYVLVFVLGFAVCALVLRSLYGQKDAQIATTNYSYRPSPAVVNDNGNRVAGAAEKIERSVVNIDTVGRPVSTGAPDFFGFSRPQEVVPKGQASGVIISSDGYILTNNHVVADTSKVLVTLYDKKQYTAQIIGRDPKTDLAVIKINKTGLPAATFANSSNLRVGDWVIAVGNALGLGTTVTVGVVSSTDRGSLNISGTVLENAIQTDAAINRGNSGGALADINGNLIGINTAIASTSPGGGSIGIGFAVPSNTAKWVATEIMNRGKVIRPWLGIRYGYLDDSVRAELKAQGQNPPPINGAYIQEVAPGSPADQAGISPGDVITKFKGQDVKSVQSISNEMKNIKVGQSIELTIWHAKTGQSGRIIVTTREMPLNP